ncbi:MAG TPA: STAS domain-containing protein [Nakamurella sp.]|nr:STAS domain-containing protein [Nakamurella sp.]
MKPVDLQVQEGRSDVLPGGRAIAVRATGDIDRVTAPKLSAAIDRALTAPGTAILVDLTGVDFLGSDGLEVLIEAAVRAQRSHRQLRVVADTRPVLRPLAVTGLDAVLSVHPSAAAARKAVAADSGFAAPRFGYPAAATGAAPVTAPGPGSGSRHWPRPARTR